MHGVLLIRALYYLWTKTGYFISGIWPRALACTWHLHSYLPKTKSKNNCCIDVIALQYTPVTYKSACNHDQARSHDAFSICLVKDKRKHHGAVDKHSSNKSFINLIRLPLFCEKTGALAMGLMASR